MNIKGFFTTNDDIRIGTIAPVSFHNFYVQFIDIDRVLIDEIIRNMDRNNISKGDFQKNE